MRSNPLRNRVTLCLGALWLVSASLDAGALKLVNGFAAAVNDKVITYEDVDEAIDPAAIETAQIQYRGQPEMLMRERDRLRSEALDILIERELILHEFDTAGYQVPEEYIEGRIKEIIRRDYGDRIRFTQSLRAQGTTPDSFRERLRETIIVNALTDKYITSGVLISPYKIQKYYEEHQDQFKLEDRVRLRMIYLEYRTTRDVDATRVLAREILAKIEAGEDFAHLASVYSDGSQRRKGGDWGWAKRDTLREDLVEVAFGLEQGQHSGVLEKSDGCYIMKVEEIEKEHVQPLSEVREPIEQELRRQESERLRKEWIEGLRKKSFVYIFPLP